MTVSKQITVEDLSNLEKRITVVVPAEVVEEKKASEFKKISQNAQIKGFRKGKVPLSVLKKQFAKPVHGEVVEKLTKESLSEAMEEKKLKPVSQLKLESVDADLGKPITIKASFEIAPEIKLMDLEKLKLEEFKVDIKDKDIDERLEQLRETNAIWHPTQEASEKGKQVKIDYEGTIKGEPFKGGSSKEVTIELGKGTMLEDFEKALIGKKAGEEFSFKLTFPKDYQAEVAGKKAEFKIKVHDVLSKELPPLDDNLAKKVGVQEGGLATLKEELKASMEKAANGSNRNFLRHQIVEQLLEKHKFDLPKTMVEAEIEQAKKEEEKKKKQPNYKVRSEKEIKKEAERKVALGLLFSKLVDTLGIKLDQAKVEERLRDMAADFSKNYGIAEDQVMEWLSKNEGAQHQLTFTTLEEQIMDEVVKKSKPKEKAMSYHDALSWKPSE
jgi:trigger factor